MKVISYYYANAVLREGRDVEGDAPRGQRPQLRGEGRDERVREVLTML